MLFVLSLLFCKGYYVRITEYGPSTVRQQRVQVTEGALAGIYVLPEEAEQYMQEHETVQCVTQPDDKLLFLGTDGILNLSANCPFVSPSTISTPAFNEQWVEYFTEYTEKEPTVIVLAKNKQCYHNLIKMASEAFTSGFYYMPRFDKGLLE